MKITTSTLFFLLLPPLLAAQSLLVDSTSQHNSTWQQQEIETNNTSGITLPAGAFKRTGDGRLLLNTGGYDGDQPDDNDRRKYSPFFIDENTMSLVETESWLLQSLDSIDHLLEQPLSKQEIEAQQQHMDELEKELVAFRQHQERTEILNIVGRLSEDEMITFRHHPGYQKSHPAHSDSNDEAYIVPGMIDLPGGSEKRATSSAASTSAASTSAASTSDGTGDGTGDNKKQKSQRAESWEQATGNKHNPPQKRGTKRKASGEDRKEFLETTATKGERKQTFQMELTRQTELFKCLFCHEFVKWDETQKEVDKCPQCCHRYCHACIETNRNNGRTSCPHCWHPNIIQEGLGDINRLEWQCQKCRTNGIVIPDMVAHIGSCNDLELELELELEQECEYDGCDFTGTQEDLSCHQLECDYRPAKIGRFEFPCYQAKYCENIACEIPEDMTEAKLSPEVAVTLLLHKIKNENWGEIERTASGVKICPACKGVCLTDQFESHIQNCGFFMASCNKCDQSLLKKDMPSHLESACNKNYQTCECDKEIIVKDMEDHKKSVCPCEQIECNARYTYNRCQQMVKRYDLNRHQSHECQFRVVQCPCCEVGLGPSPALRDTHLQYCCETKDFLGKRFRCLKSVIPIYVYEDHEAMLLLVIEQDAYNIYRCDRSTPTELLSLEVYRTTDTGL